MKKAVWESSLGAISTLGERVHHWGSWGREWHTHIWHSRTWAAPGTRVSRVRQPHTQRSADSNRRIIKPSKDPPGYEHLAETTQPANHYVTAYLIPKRITRCKCNPHAHPHPHTPSPHPFATRHTDVRTKPLKGTPKQMEEWGIRRGWTDSTGQ